MRLKTRDAQTVDLNGATVYPGFTDSHLHILNLAHTARGLELGTCKTRAAGTEERLGRIQTGFLADMSAFPKDFSQIPAEEIQLQSPVMTVVGGRVREHTQK